MRLILRLPAPPPPIAAATPLIAITPMFSLRFARLRHADFSRFVAAAFDFSPRYAAPPAD
jgi:hypothetical protein